MKWQFAHTQPYASFEDIRMTRPESRVQTEDASPWSESLARASASASSSKGVMVRHGPKISERTISSVFLASATTVGWKKNPGPSIGAPPVRTRMCGWAFARATRAATRSRCALEIMGPSSVAASPGGPTLRDAAAPASLAQTSS
eukprot:Amastigsp_a176310_44.p3 type:complete len:145 gc:universal Amastigsp_a176310_44:1374-940(-)